MERYVCIHGHFYQPPRENPWLEEVELQDAAYPYHDWNERITEECYWPNAASRILGKGKKIVDVVNNYTRISSDFGPTLLTWLERHEPRIYATILDADKQSQELFGGHGGAMAQAYNHMIMPLANSRDKKTQVIWGIEDFVYRFKRRPEGMWLPETAVDLETLGIMAEQGIRFAVLSPVQASQVKPLNFRDWINVEKEKIDTTRPYQCWLPSGGSIALFFYHGAMAQAAASGSLLQNGELFAEALTSIVANGSDRAGLAHIATDGETFGHHHRHTDMALAYAIHLIETNRLAKMTVYGQFLEMFPPTWEVRIRENTSWSCSHGVERWRDNCGCASDSAAMGKQQWRKPLRQAMDDLRGRLSGLFETQMAPYCSDPWAARDEYIKVINGQSAEATERFVTGKAGRSLSEDQTVRFLKLLDMQRNAMLMYTSCAWFFDDIAGTEAVQVLHYACRAMQLAKELGSEDLEPGFEAVLEHAPASTKGLANGKEVYDLLVKPNRADLDRIAAHLAVSSIFEQCPQRIEVYCYEAEFEACERHQTGLRTLCTGRGTITSNIVRERRTVDFAAYRFSEQDIIAAVASPLSDKDFQTMQNGLHEAFDQGDTTEIIRLMNLTFGGSHYSLRHLLKDEQRRLLYQLLDTTWQEIEVGYRQIYQRNFTVMHLMRGMGIPLPKALAAAAEFVINQDLLKTMLSDPADPAHLKDMVDEAKWLSVPLDQETLEFEAGRRINDLLDQVEATPDDAALLETTEATLGVLSTVVSAPNVQASQNILSRLTRELYFVRQRQAAEGDSEAKTWVSRFQQIAQYLGVIV